MLRPLKEPFLNKEAPNNDDGPLPTLTLKKRKELSKEKDEEVENEDEVVKKMNIIQDEEAEMEEAKKKIPECMTSFLGSSTTASISTKKRRKSSRSYESKKFSEMCVDYAKSEHPPLLVSRFDEKTYKEFEDFNRGKDTLLYGASKEITENFRLNRIFCVEVLKSETTSKKRIIGFSQIEPFALDFTVPIYSNIKYNKYNYRIIRRVPMKEIEERFPQYKEKFKILSEKSLFGHYHTIRGESFNRYPAVNIYKMYETNWKLDLFGILNKIFS